MLLFNWIVAEEEGLDEVSGVFGVCLVLVRYCILSDLFIQLY